jgi:hypothetical protein
MDANPYITTESPLWWRCVRYGVTAVVSFCVVTIASLICWGRFGEQQVSLDFTDANFFSGITLSPSRLTAGVILAETAPPLTSIRFVNASLEFTVVPKKDFRTPSTPSTSPAARFGIDGEFNLRKRAFWFYVRLSILSTAFCLAGLSYLIFAAHFRRVLRDPSRPL